MLDCGARDRRRAGTQQSWEAAAHGTCVGDSECARIATCDCTATWTTAVFFSSGKIWANHTHNREIYNRSERLQVVHQKP